MSHLYSFHKDMFMQYEAVRGINALEKDSLSNTLINAPALSQVCDTFGKKKICGLHCFLVVLVYFYSLTFIFYEKVSIQAYLS